MWYSASMFYFFQNADEFKSKMYLFTNNHKFDLKRIKFTGMPVG